MQILIEPVINNNEGDKHSLETSFLLAHKLLEEGYEVFLERISRHDKVKENKPYDKKIVLEYSPDKERKIKSDSEYKDSLKDNPMKYEVVEGTSDKVIVNYFPLDFSTASNTLKERCLSNRELLADKIKESLKSPKEEVAVAVDEEWESLPSNEEEDKSHEGVEIVITEEE